MISKNLAIIVSSSLYISLYCNSSTCMEDNVLMDFTLSFLAPKHTLEYRKLVVLSKKIGNITNSRVGHRLDIKCRSNNNGTLQ